MKNLLLASFLLVASITGAQVFDTSPSGSGSGGAPSGSAGGDLGGTYPNPTVTHSQAGSVDFSTITTALSGKLSSTAGVPVGLVDHSTITTALATKASTGTDNSMTRELQAFNFGGALTISGAANFLGAMQISTPTAKTSAYTMTSADRVVFASSTLGQQITTVTLPSASALLGQMVSIYKADKSTIPVVIVTPAGGADTIVGLSTIPLFGYGSGQDLISDGNHTWFPVGGPLKAPETFIGHDELAGSPGALTANTMYFMTVRVNAPCTVKSIRYKGGTASGNMSVAMYDYNGQVVLSSGPFTMASGSSNGEQATLAVPVYVQPGVYYLGVGLDNGTGTLGRYGINGAAGYFSLASNVSPPAASITPSAGGSSNNQPAVGLMCAGISGGYAP